MLENTLGVRVQSLVVYCHVLTSKNSLEVMGAF
jgi:hypothetical protein